MDETILSYINRPLKDEYQTTQESLSAKVQQATGLSRVMMNHPLSDEESYLLHWCQMDLLKAAFKECEELTFYELIRPDEPPLTPTDERAKKPIDTPVFKAADKPVKKSAKPLD